MSGTTTPPTPGDPAAFLAPASPPPGPAPYPKTLWHPVHGMITIPDAATEARLLDPRDWFRTAEEADMHRTADQAWLVHQASLNAKLKVFADGTPPAAVISDSNQAMQAAKAAADALAAGTVSNLGGTTVGTPGSTTGTTGTTGA